MTKHKNARQFDTTNATIVRRKRGKVRFQDNDTARFSGWMLDPARPAQASDEALENLAVALKPEADNLARMTKAELQALADNAKVPYNTKTTKAALIEALTA
jgi:hypothetical protein